MIATNQSYSKRILMGNKQATSEELDPTVLSEKDIQTIRAHTSFGPENIDECHNEFLVNIQF